MIIFTSILACLSLAVTSAPVAGQERSGDAWRAGVEILKSVAPGDDRSNTTVIERKRNEAPTGADPEVRLVALLTSDGQQIDQGLVWRIFENQDERGKSRLVSEIREASPTLRLKPGDYTINAAFGRAHLTRQIVVTPEKSATEQFVLNAGGLRVKALHRGREAPGGVVTYAIYADENEQFTSSTLIMPAAKPELIIRLNAGIYRIVSKFGDGNAKIEADVTVEAGKLTETTVTHAAGRAAFKLVNRPGGEALPDAVWTIQTRAGEIVKETVGALPSHYFAPGEYVVIAKSAGQIHTRRFEVRDGETSNVEVVRGATSIEDAGISMMADEDDGSGITDSLGIDPAELMPSLNFRSP